MSAIPPINSSNSRSSKTLTSSGGINSLKPVMKALNWSSTRFWIRHSVIRLGIGQHPFLWQHWRVTYLTYSSLFSSVTSMFWPFGFKSIVLTSPKILSSVEKVMSSPDSSIGVSLQFINTARQHRSQHELTKCRLNSCEYRRPHLPYPLVSLSFGESSCKKRQ